MRAVNGIRIFSPCAALAMFALLFATGPATAGSGNDHGPATAGSGNDHGPATAGSGNDHGSSTAGTADHHAAGQTHAASDTGATPGTPSDQAGTDTRHCPSDHPISFKIMTCCMAMVPDQVAALYRHIAITVHPSRRVVAHDRTIRPPLKPPQPSV